MSRDRDFSRTFSTPLYQFHNSSIAWFSASFLNMDKKVETYTDWALILAGNGAKKVGNWQCLGTGTFRELLAAQYIGTGTRLLPCFLPVSWTWIKEVETHPDYALLLGWNGAKKVKNWQCLGFGTFQEPFVPLYYCTVSCILPLCSACLLGNCLLFV